MKRLWERRNFIFGVIWICLLVPGLLWWSESIPFLIICSVYANIMSSFGADEARRSRQGK